jgi:hypothetical protein
MVYSHQFVAAVKVNGSILRETAGKVAVPFGSEYAVYLKNLASVRAMARVEIDGTDATEGTWLILGPNSSMDLGRFIRNGNLQSGNRFKFIKRTQRIEESRGIKGEDGLVRIEYKFVKLPDPEVHTHHYNHYHDYHYPYYPYWPYWHYWDYPYTWGGSWTSSNSSGSLSDNVSFSANSGGLSDNVSFSANSGGLSDNVSFSANSGGIRGAQASGHSGGGILRGKGLNASMMSFTKSAGDTPTVNVNTSESLQAKGFGAPLQCFAMQEASAEEPGITVPGSQSNQEFYSAGGFPTEAQTHVLVLRLTGTVGGKAATRAVTVKTKAKCQTCGTSNKSGVKFCKECGTSLEVF